LEFVNHFKIIDSKLKGIKLATLIIERFQFIDGQAGCGWRTCCHNSTSTGVGWKKR